MHTSVYLKEAVDALNVVAGGVYVDATFGEGGHAREIVNRGGSVIGIDADPVQAQKQSEIKVLNGSFAQIAELISTEGITNVNGVLFDFGLSMVQLKTGKKGLSYKNDDEPLDMRLSGKGMSAEDYVNVTLDGQLVDDLMRYSEDLNAERIAHSIVRFRQDARIETVGDLKEIIDSAIRHSGSTETYARIFQALRIIVNDEFESIRKGLEGALSIVHAGGKIVVISFHSLEDRIVKAFVREHSDRLSHERLQVHKQRRLASFERSATLRVMTVI